MALDAGKLNRRIVLQRATYTRNALNEKVATWETIREVSAEFTPVSDSERVDAAAVSAEITARFVIRWARLLSDLNPKDRLLYEGRTFEIVAVKELGYHDGFEISAAARADA